MTSAFVFSEADRKRQKAALKYFENLPHPICMTPQERADELLSLRNPPLGIPFGMVDERIQLLIGRRFSRGEHVSLGSNLENFNEWIKAIECPPAIGNIPAWEALAQEAHSAYGGER